MTTHQENKATIRVHRVYLGNRDGTIPPHPPVRFGTFPPGQRAVVRQPTPLAPGPEATEEGEVEEREAWAGLAASAREDWLSENPF